MDSMGSSGGANDKLLEQLREEIVDKDETIAFNLDCFNMQASALNEEIEELKTASKGAASSADLGKMTEENKELKKEISNLTADYKSLDEKSNQFKSDIIYFEKRKNEYKEWLLEAEAKLKTEKKLREDEKSASSSA
jgi:chromosome segregation ATPase